MNDTDTARFSYAMPSLGADMDEGSVIEWLVSVGDSVERGQVVARVETEKSDIDIETWRAGVVDEIVVGLGETVPVGTVLLHLLPGVSEGDRPVGVAPEETSVDDETPSSDPVESPIRPRPAANVRAPRPRQGGVWATPLARRLAGTRGIALSEVTGTGPEGAIRSSDLPELASLVAGGAASEPLAAADVVEPRSRTERMRSIIAARMTRSNSEIPHYRLQRDIDLGSLVEHLAMINADRPMSERIVPAAALVRSVALAAKRHPAFNGTWSGGRFRPGLGVNVSMAISLRGGGLVTPTIRHADDVSLDETMRLLREFTTVARTGVMRSEWTANDSSITVTNLGDRGADLVHGLISPPEVALVGFGRITERPTVVDGNVVPRPIVIATLAADHRATDGAVGSRFLATLADALENPEQL